MKFLCEQCDAEFQAAPGKHRRFCSKKCSGASKRSTVAGGEGLTVKRLSPTCYVILEDQLSGAGQKTIAVFSDERSALAQFRRWKDEANDGLTFGLVKMSQLKKLGIGL